AGPPRLPTFADLRAPGAGAAGGRQLPLRPASSPAALRLRAVLCGPEAGAQCPATGGQQHQQQSDRNHHYRHQPDHRRDWELQWNNHRGYSAAGRALRAAR
ncbi:hypothetical protein KR067_010100, partial [Drosophila pandora]